VSRRSAAPVTGDRPLPAVPEPERLAEFIRQHRGRATAAEATYLGLRQAIYQGAIPEGTVLRERELASALGVSRTPIRESLARLEAEGIVVAIPHGGVVVAEVSPQDVEEIYELRAGIEGMAARLAAQRASDAELAALGEVLQEMTVLARDGQLESLPPLAARFHRLLYEAARNRRLQALAVNCYEAVQRVKRSSLMRPGRAGQALEEHRRILAALRRRDPEAAERAAREHLERALRARRELGER
jgi:DNA-binding GntR family transcriptional regulator